MYLPALGPPAMLIIFLLNCSVAQETVVALYNMQGCNGQPYAYLKGGNDGSCISLKDASGWFKVTSFGNGCQVFGYVLGNPDCGGNQINLINPGADASPCFPISSGWTSYQLIECHDTASFFTSIAGPGATIRGVGPTLGLSSLAFSSRDSRTVSLPSPSSSAVSIDIPLRESFPSTPTSASTQIFSGLQPTSDVSTSSDPNLINGTGDISISNNTRPTPTASSATTLPSSTNTPKDSGGPSSLKLVLLSVGGAVVTALIGLIGNGIYQWWAKRGKDEENRARRDEINVHREEIGLRREEIQNQRDTNLLTRRGQDMQQAPVNLQQND